MVLVHLHSPPLEQQCWFNSNLKNAHTHIHKHTQDTCKETIIYGKYVSCNIC